MKPMLLDDTDTFMVTETKLDDSFPVSKFNVEGFTTPFRLDQNKNGESIILFIRSYIIASKLISFMFPNDIEVFFLEINLKGNKWLICCSYNPNRIFASNHQDHECGYTRVLNCALIKHLAYPLVTAQIQM